MKIGNIETKNNIFLAPMAGVTTPGFRTICIENNAGLVVAEMVSDKGLLYGNEKTYNMLDVWDNEHPMAMQIFGSDIESMTNAARVIDEKCTADIIDINMGCPVPKIVKNGAGSALMKTPDKIYDIVKSITDHVKKPVTVKIRLGWDHDSINCVEVAKKIELAGASAIAIHARTRSDQYLGTPKYEYIKKVKEVVSIPVIGNGDITDIESAQKVFDTGCDGIMIGRAACGNPWIFNELATYFETGKIVERPTKDEIIDMMINHAQKLTLQKGEHIALVEMRTHAAWYLRNLIGTKNYKMQIVSVSSFKDLVQIANRVRQDPKVYLK